MRLADLSSPTVTTLASPPVIGWDAVAFLLNDSLAAARLRIIANNGDEVPKEKFIRQNVSWVPRGIDVGVDHKSVQLHWDKGATLMIPYAAHATTSILGFCEAIEDKFADVHCDAHIFVSSCAGNSSFPKHSDDSHNLIVPVEGRILVMVYGPDDQSKNLLVSAILEPGQALFIPKGYWHHVQPVERRLSLSFPFAVLPDRQRQDRQRVRL